MLKTVTGFFPGNTCTIRSSNTGNTKVQNILKCKKRPSTHLSLFRDDFLYMLLHRTVVEPLSVPLKKLTYFVTSKCLNLVKLVCEKWRLSLIDKLTNILQHTVIRLSHSGYTKAQSMYLEFWTSSFLELHRHRKFTIL